MPRLRKQFPPHSDILQGHNGVFIMVIQHANPQASEFGGNLVVDVAVFRPMFVRISIVGFVLAKDRPVAELSAILVVGPDKLPDGGAFVVATVSSSPEGNPRGNESV